MENMPDLSAIAAVKSTVAAIAVVFVATAGVLATLVAKAGLFPLEVFILLFFFIMGSPFLSNV